VGLLVALGRVNREAVDGLTILGELGLDGAIRGVRGVLSVARHLSSRSADGRGLVLPPANVSEAGLVRSVPLVAPATLCKLAEMLGTRALKRTEPEPRGPPNHQADDFADVVGQDAAKRALEIAAAGGHACPLVGPPGAGKTMLARRMP
jgi:magnesium chelatase family protein